MAETSQGGAKPTAKLCGTCGLDCSGKPRVKDPKGNYMCMECVDRAKAARDVQTGKTKPAPTAPADLGTVNLADHSDNSFLLAMDDKAADKADKSKKPCPSCLKRIPIEAVVCINCGFNSKTGEQMHVRVLKPKNTK